MKTYHEMNTEIVKILRFADESSAPYCHYAAARIEELEIQNIALLKACKAAEDVVLYYPECEPSLERRRRVRDLIVKACEGPPCPSS